MALLEKVRAERLDDIERSLKAGERGELGPLHCWPRRLIHSRVKRESSGRKVISVV